MTRDRPSPKAPRRTQAPEAASPIAPRRGPGRPPKTGEPRSKMTLYLPGRLDIALRRYQVEQRSATNKHRELSEIIAEALEEYLKRKG